MDILGVRIDNLSRKDILEKAASFLEQDGLHQIATVNPEFILTAQEDNEFKTILNQADLCVADGVGVWFAFLRYGKILKSRLTGVDLMEEILSLASTKQYLVSVVMNVHSLSSWEEVRYAILKKYPTLKIRGVVLENFHHIDDLIFESKILLCNFGAPRQEKFIHSLKTRKHNQIRLAIGVGGGMDFLTGKVRRAPKLWRKIGLEWSWRFAQEPRYRAKRIFRAVVLFPIKIIFN